jgi:acyl carrier protein
MSNLTQIEDSVISLVAGVIRAPVDLASSASTLSEWDSLAQMRIIIQLEKTYDIEIEDENLGKLNSVANIVTYLQGKLG